MVKIKSIKKLNGGTVEVLTSTKNYYFTRNRYDVEIMVFDAKIKDDEKALKDVYEIQVEQFNMSKQIGADANKKVKKLLGM